MTITYIAPIIKTPAGLLFVSGQTAPLNPDDPSIVTLPDGSLGLKVDSPAPSLERPSLGDVDVSALIEQINAASDVNVNYIIRMIEDLTNTLKKAHRELRFADAQAAFKEMNNQADQIHDAAWERFQGALAAAIIGFVLGAASTFLGIWGAAKALGSGGPKLQAAKNDVSQLKIKLSAAQGNQATPAQGSGSVAQIQADLQAAEATLGKITANISTKVQGLSSAAYSGSALTQALTGASTAGGEYAASDDDVDKKESEAKQELYELGRDSASKLMDALQDLNTASIQLLADIESSREQAFSRVISA